jgi:hypothetical protein
MTRRPFLLLAVLMGIAAIVHAMIVPASTPADFKGDLPPGMRCTVCGPISTGECLLDVPTPFR